MSGVIGLNVTYLLDLDLCVVVVGLDIGETVVVVCLAVPRTRANGGLQCGVLWRTVPGDAVVEIHVVDLQTFQLE